MLVNLVRAVLICIYSLYCAYALKMTLRYVFKVMAPNTLAYFVVLNLFFAYTEAFVQIVLNVGNSASFWTYYNTVLFAMALYLLWRFDKGVDINPQEGAESGSTYMAERRFRAYRLDRLRRRARRNDSRTTPHS